MTALAPDAIEAPPNGRAPRMPLDRIEAVAADVDFSRGTRRVVAALFYYPGRFVGALVEGLGLCVAAWKVGYRDGRGKTRREAGTG